MVQYVVAAGNGDTDAMAKLYSKTLKASYFLAAKLSESESEAVEITKKAYARAFCSIDKLKKPEAFEIWIKQIVASIYKDNAKFIFNDADGNAQEESSDFLPEAILDDESKAAKVMEAIAKLTPERKTAVILHYYTGMPVSALAKYFGVSESTANAILGKAKADILENSGVSTPEYPEIASLPVLTRLFKNLVAKMGIDNNAVREIFVFAIEAYAAAKPKDVIPESEPAKEEKAEKTSEESAETVEEKDESADEEVSEESETEESADTDEEEKAEESVEEEPSQETDEEETETVEEAEESEEVTEGTDDGKAEMEENILSFKNKISSMLGIDPSEKPAEDNAEENVIKEDSEKENSEALPIDDDAFEMIKRSVEGLSDITEIDSAEETVDEGAVSFADFAGAGNYIKEEPAEINEQQDKEIKKSNKPKTAKKAVKINPKILIAAAVILVVIIVAVVLIVKGSKKDDNAATTVSTTVGYSNEKVEWVAIPELSDFEEIEYLNEKFSSFKDPDTGKYGLIDYQGNVVLEAEFDGFRRCSEGRYYGEGGLDASNYHVVAEKDGKEYRVDMVGNTAGYKEHTAHATSNDSSMNSGNYDERDRYYEGYAAARKDGKWGYVTMGNEKVVVPYEFEAVNNISADEPSATFDYCRGSVNGYIAVKKDGKMGIIKIDQDGYKVVVDYKYDVICQGKNGIFLAFNGTEWGNIVIGSASDAGNSGEVESTTLLPATTAPQEVSIGKYVINADETNIRSAPDTDKDNVIASLNEGYKVTALEKKKGSNGSDWVRFDYNGQEAWVSIKKLDKAD